MKAAKIHFKDRVPYSEEFGDIYFNTYEPLNESKYVFVSALDEIWESKDRFIIAEAGFGAGLNFLTAFNKFKNSDKFRKFNTL